MKNIIVGVNFSNECKAALKAGKALSDSLGIPLKVIHAFPAEFIFNVTSSLDGFFRPKESEMEVTLTKRLEEFIDSLSLDAKDIDHQIIFGDRESVFTELDQAIEEPLFIFGFGRRSVLQRVLVGSFIMKCTKALHSPVLAVRNENIVNIKRVAALTDFSDVSSNVLETVRLFKKSINSSF